MLPALALILLTILQSVLSQQPQGCSCDQQTDICSCCAGVPNVPFLTVCAIMEWVPATKNINTTITFSGVEWPPVIFNQSNPDDCIVFSQNPQTEGCFELRNFTITKIGACGEFFVELKIFIDVAFPLGVFKFGDTGNFPCPANPYPPPPSPPTPTPVPPPPRHSPPPPHKFAYEEFCHKMPWLCKKQ